MAMFILRELLSLSVVTTVQPVDLDANFQITLWSMEQTPRYKFPA